MITLIYGGSGSGKSEYAEDLVVQSNYKDRFYLATMAASDEESRQRVTKHRKQRSGKGFVTLEHPVDIKKAILQISEITSGDFETDIPESRASVVLLECMSNLVANEMFRDGIINSKDYCVNKILEEVEELAREISSLIIVSNNIYEDGVDYDQSTKDYLQALGEINCRLAEQAVQVIEVVVGIPVIVK